MAGASFARGRSYHLAPLSIARLDALGRKQPADCMEQPDCQYAVAEEAGARSVLRAVVKETDRKEATPLAAIGSCTVTLTYLDVNTGQVTATTAANSLLCQGAPLTEALAVCCSSFCRCEQPAPRRGARGRRALPRNLFHSDGGRRAPRGGAGPYGRWRGAPAVPGRMKKE